MSADAIDLDADVELVHANPDDLIIGPNVRRDPEYKQLVLSVAARGVIVAVTAHWDEDGHLVVIDGQRRTLAAREAGVDIPVFIREQPDETGRIVDQLAANTHRQDLDVADTATAYEQLTVRGMSEDDIASLAAVRREHVAAHLAIARSPGALGTARQHPQMTLDQGVVLADFEGDKDATSNLVLALTKGGFDHVAQREKDRRDERAAVDALTEEIRAAGGVVIDEHVGYGVPRVGEPIARVIDLYDDGDRLSVSRHESCPGHAAFIEVAFDATTNTRRPQAAHVCLDWRKYGHGTGVTPVGAPAAVSDLATKRATRAERAEKARVEAGDAAWSSASTVRRRWIDDLLQHGTGVPDGAEWYLLEQVLSNDLAIEDDAITALRALGREIPADTEDLKHPFLVERMKRPAKPARAVLLTLWAVLAGADASMQDPSTWRTTSLLRRDLTVARLADLARFGYELAPIEQALVLGDRWEP